MTVILLRFTTIATTVATISSTFTALQTILDAVIVLAIVFTMFVCFATRESTVHVASVPASLQRNCLQSQYLSPYCLVEAFSILLSIQKKRVIYFYFS